MRTILLAPAAIAKAAALRQPDAVRLSYIRDVLDA
jgi:hypothetical protein